MTLKIIKKSIGGSRFQKILALVTIIASSLLISCMLNITLGIGNQIAKDLRSYGSNIVVLPKGAVLSVEVGDEIYSPLQSESYLEESKLHLIKEIFWRNNITAFAPFLDIKVVVGDLGESSLRGRIVDSHEATQNTSRYSNISQSESEESKKSDNRFVDSSPTAQNDESSVDCHDSTRCVESRNDEIVAESTESTNKTQQTIEGIAVEVLDLEKNLGAKLDLESVSLPNFSSSAKDAPKSKLPQSAVIFTGTYFDKIINVQDEPEFSTGIKMLYHAWSVEGEWISDDALDAVLVGSEFAKMAQIQKGDILEIASDSGANQSYKVKVSGILFNSGVYDNRIVGSLALAQKLIGKDNIFAKAEVSAFTIPENTLSYKARRNIDSLNAVEFDTWYCSAFASSIAYQIEEDFKGTSAKAQIKVSDAESSIVRKIQGLMGVTSIICLLVSSVGIGALLSAEFQRRRKEIGLMKVLGASMWQIYGIFAGESCVIAIVGAIIGFFGGVGVAELISISIFAHTLPISWIALPLSIVFALFVSLCGSLFLLKNINALLPAQVLYGR